jgi:hypothetical protein
MPLALLGLLWLGATCAQRPPAPGSAAPPGDVATLLSGACQRTLANLAPEREPAQPAPLALPPELGPALRALHGTGMGGRVDALESAVERSARLALADTGPWLTESAARFAPERSETLLAGADDAISAAFRDAREADLRAQLAPAAERRLEETGAPAALADVRARASRLPLPRKVDVDLVSVVTDRAVASFFAVLAEEERRMRQEVF